jgi:ABC-type sugar transport system substrate-binding protein
LVVGLLVGLIFAGMSIALSACGGSGGGDSGSGGGSKGALAMSFGGLEPVLWDETIKTMKPEIEKAGYEFLVDDPQFKVEKQVADWEAWIAQGDVKAIDGYPVQVDAIVPVTQRANEAGISVLGYTQNWEGTKAALLTDPVKDGETLGRATGEWIAEHYGTSKPVDVGMLTEKAAEIGIGRVEGEIKGLNATAPNAVIHEVPTPGFARSAGYDGAESLLQAHPDTKVWISQADESLLGAYRAVLASGVSKTDPNYFFGSLDITPESLAVMKIPNSIWRVGYIFPPSELAEINSRLLIESAEGKKVHDLVATPTKITPQNWDQFYTSSGGEEETGAEEAGKEEEG